MQQTYATVLSSSSRRRLFFCPPLIQTLSSPAPDRLDNGPLGHQLREDHDDVLFALYNDNEIICHSKALEALIYKDILNLFRRDKPRGRARKVRLGALACLDTEAPHHKQALGRVDS